MNTASVRMGPCFCKGNGVGGTLRGHGAGAGKSGGGDCVSAAVCPCPSDRVAHINSGGALISNISRPVEIVRGCLADEEETQERRA